jgi:O-acetyl-ADP-ribose deacetylase (regulator of RNase III)
MIHYLETTVFNSGAQTITNTVNCHGVMGAGLALEFKLRYPKMEEDYQERCKRKDVRVGKPYLYKGDYPQWILNFPTKNHWRYPSKLSWIEDGLRYFCDRYEIGKISSVAFPKLGCSRGGLEWPVVREIMESYLRDLSIEVIICLDEERNATGVEAKMLEMIKEPNSSLRKRLSSSEQRTIPKIQEASPRRFRDIARISGVGKTSYESIFTKTYLEASKEALDSTVRDKEPVFFQASILEAEIQLDTLKKEVAQVETATRVTAFDLVWPELSRLLATPCTREEIAESLEVPKTLASSWIKKGVELQKVKRAGQKPIKYVLS